MGGTHRRFEGIKHFKLENDVKVHKMYLANVQSLIVAIVNKKDISS
jgi:hypothetical protein